MSTAPTEAVRPEAPEDADLERRNLAMALLGALGGAAFLESCTSEDPSLAAVPIAQIEEALAGTNVTWVDAIGTAPVTGTNRNLRGTFGTNSPFAVALGFGARGDGGGGIFAWMTTSATDDGGTIIVAGQSVGSTTGGSHWKRIYSGPLNVRWFGAKGDGVTPDGPAIQRTIDCATGNANPTTTIRFPKAAVYLPSGVYPIHGTSAGPGLIIRSVMGFRLFGDGPHLSILLVPQNVTLDSVLEIDGSADGTFEAFSLESPGNSTDPTTGTADKMVYLHFSTLAFRSTSNNVFRNVVIGGGNYGARFRVGFAVGTDNGTRQCDATTFESCLVSGAWVPGEASFYQCAWEFGSGVHGNNLNHVLYGSSWGRVRYGLFMNAVNASTYGAQPAGCEVEIYISGSAFPVVIDSLRSESSQRLLVHVGGASDSRVTLRGIQFNAGLLASDGLWISHNTGGLLSLDNVSCVNAPSGVVPLIQVTVPGPNNVSCIAHGVASASAVNQAFQSGSGTYLTIVNYHQLDASNVPIAITPFKVLGPGIDFHIP